MTTNVYAPQALVQNPSIISTSVGEDLALMSIEKARYYSLDPIASDIWKRFESPTNLNDLAGALANDYRGDAQQIRADLHDLIGQFLEQELLRAAKP